MSTRFACSRSEFKSWVSLLIFCLVDLSNIDSEMLMSHTIIVWESKSLCMSLITCFMNLGAPVLGACIFSTFSSSCCIDPFTIHYVMGFFVFFDLCWLKSVLSETRLAIPVFLFLLFFAFHLLDKSSSIPLF